MKRKQFQESSDRFGRREYFSLVQLGKFEDGFSPYAYKPGQLFTGV